MTAAYTNSDDDNPVDLARVTKIIWESNADSAADITHFYPLWMWNKRAYPVPCHLTDYEEKQVGRNPAGILLFDVRMKLEEVVG